MQKKKEYGLKDIIYETNFYKFSQVYCPLIVVNVFVLIYLATIYISYKSTLNALNEVNLRFNIFNQTSGRARYTLEVCRIAYANLLYKDFYTNGYSKRVNNAIQSPPRISNISSFNSNLTIGLSQIEDDYLHELFYEKNIRIYNNDFTEIPDTNAFRYADSFTATNILISTTERLMKIFLTEDLEQYDLEYFIMTNSFNDLAIQNLKLMHEIGKNMIQIINDVVDLNSVMLNLTLTGLFLSIFSVLVVYIKSYLDFCTFLSSFIDPGSEYLMTFIHAMQSNRTKPNHLDRVKKVDKKSVNLKMPNRSIVLRILFYRLVVLCVVLLSPLGLLIKSNSIISFNQSHILSTTNDLINMNNLRMQGLYTIALSILSFTYPDGKSLYIRNWDNFAIQNDKILDLISSDIGFTDAAKDYLQLDVCQYYVYHPTRPNCTILSGGIGKSGSLTTMISVQTYYTQLVYGLSISDHNATTINGMIIQTDFLDNYYIISNGVSPALGVFQDDLLANLNKSMNSESDITIFLFAIGAILGFFIISLVYGCTSLIIWAERRKLAKLILIVPPKYLLNNKELKQQLLEQTREFGRIMKKIELSKVT